MITKNFGNKTRAIELRKKYYSYSQIQKKINVSKGTLSNWLKEYPLPKHKIKVLRDINKNRIEKFKQTMLLKKQKRLDIEYQKNVKRFKSLTKRELLIAGLFLYWGEGSKRMNEGLIICNTDPQLIKFSISWLTRIIGIPKKNLKACLHLYKDMNINKETNFWKKELDFKNKQFRKPYIKKKLSTKINHNGFRHGTCTIFGGNVRQKEMVMTSIKVISNKCIKSGV